MRRAKNGHERRDDNTQKILGHRKLSLLLLMQPEQNIASPTQGFQPGRLNIERFPLLG
jgi:hypothetical protein